MSLGKPTQRITLEDLKIGEGRGNAQTLLAATALTEWDENIPHPQFASREERRENILIWASAIGVHPLELMAIVLLLKRQERSDNYPERFAA